MSDWEHFEHEADIGVRGYGKTQAQAFANAALAMTAVVTDPSLVKRRESLEISCSASDPEILLVEFLDSVIYEMVTRRMLFSRFDVTIRNGELFAVAWGEPLEVARHEPAVEIKGATVTMLKVEELDDGRWLAQTVVDV